jgi:hypothetical protein
MAATGTLYAKATNWANNWANNWATAGWLDNSMGAVENGSLQPSTCMNLLHAADVGNR